MYKVYYVSWSIIVILVKGAIIFYKEEGASVCGGYQNFLGYA